MKRISAFALLAAVVVAVPARAQVVRTQPGMARISFGDEPNSARIGVYLGNNDLSDTLGVLVGSVIEDGPAAKAGLKEGDRIQSIDGVNLRMSRADAEDEMLRGMMARRLTRELDKKKAGDEVELRVLTAGSSRSVRVKTVASRELAQATPRRAPAAAMTQRLDDRAAIGASLGGRVTKRDTLGVLITSVSPDGPAEKAGVVEGDRIARINGVDLRVPPEEAGDAELSRARIRRATTELQKLKAGDAVTLTVVSAGRSREVNVTAVKASELKDGDYSFFFGDGSLRIFDREEMMKGMPHLQALPLKINTRIPRVLEFSPEFNDGKLFYRYDDGGDVKIDVRERVQRAIEAAREASQRAREAEVIRARVVPRVTIRT